MQKSIQSQAEKSVVFSQQIYCVLGNKDAWVGVVAGAELT
jgi:hypothetical protein